MWVWFHDETERYPCWSPPNVVGGHGPNGPGRFAVWLGIRQSVERPRGIFSQSQIGNWWWVVFPLSRPILPFPYVVARSTSVVVAAAARLAAELTAKGRKVVLIGRRKSSCSEPTLPESHLYDLHDPFSSAFDYWLLF